MTVCLSGLHREPFGAPNVAPYPTFARRRMCSGHPGGLIGSEKPQGRREYSPTALITKSSIIISQCTKHRRVSMRSSYIIWAELERLVVIPCAPT